MIEAGEHKTPTFGRVFDLGSDFLRSRTQIIHTWRCEGHFRKWLPLELESLEVLPTRLAVLQVAVMLSLTLH